MDASSIVRRATFTFTAGILRCGEIRDYLQTQKFKGMNIEWRESRGWIEREWIVRGNVEDVMRIQRDIMICDSDETVPV